MLVCFNSKIRLICKIRGHRLEIHVDLLVPLWVDVESRFNLDSLDVRSDFRVEGIVHRIGMLGDEGTDLLREADDTILSNLGQMAGLHVVDLHLGIRRTRSLLRARKAQEGDHY